MSGGSLEFSKKWIISEISLLIIAPYPSRGGGLSRLLIIKMPMIAEGIRIHDLPGLNP